MPMTVTNSNPYSQLTNNATWFGNNKLSFTFPKIPSGLPDGVSEINSLEASMHIYPNPARSMAIVGFVSGTSSSMEVSVKNALGQTVRTLTTQSVIGENAIAIDLSGLSSGIYLVNVKTGGAMVTKKLLVD